MMLRFFSLFVLCPVQFSPSQPFLSRHATLLPNKLTEERYMTRQKLPGEGDYQFSSFRFVSFCYAKLFHWPNNLAPFFSQSEEKPPLSIKLQEQDIILLVKRNVIGSFEPLRILIEQNGVFSHNVTAAILAVTLVCETNPVGVELFSYVIAFFCLHKCWPRV